MKLRHALLVATVLVAPIAAKAQPISGLYIGGGAGYNYMQTTTLTSQSALSSAKGKANDWGGPAAVVSVGYGLGNGLRMELEGDYRYDHYRAKKFPIASGVTGGGDLQTYGPMFNVLYDFYIPKFPVMPYVGIGGGYQFSSVTNGNLYSGANNFHSNKEAGGSIAAQAIFGLAYNIPGVPGLALTAEYRFMALPQDAKIHGVATVAGVTSAGAEKFGNMYNHAALVGLRYAFNAAPPPPPPAPVPVAAPGVQPSKSYLVFFDWDRADLTARARQIIAEAAQGSTKVQYTKIEVNGYTDLSGTATYNQGLSVRRAETVAAELVKDGVPRTAIDIHGYGESHPLVPTAAGVREPQNRRVEIFLK